MSDPISELKQELLAAAERQLEHPAPQARRLRSRILVLAASLSIATAVAFVVTAPWQSSPGFLERAEAALTPPDGSIVHYRWNTETSGDICEGSHEMWNELAPPYAYRLLLTDCGGGVREVGGVLGNPKRILEFVPPNSLVVPDLIFDRPPDPVASLRAAIREGSAYDDGTTQLNGRTVVRIRMDCPPGAPCAGRPSYVYVDRETFFPVKDEFPAAFTASWTAERYDIVTRYQAFEYLPRTAANLALTDIRAQHPDAIGP
jgi:hypothetical protein